MIGRGAIGRPTIFHEIKSALVGRFTIHHGTDGNCTLLVLAEISPTQ